MRTRFIALVILAGVLSGVRGLAIPTLQLDIVGGVYDPATQTTVATSPIFELRALLNGALSPGATYYISAAITPGQVQTNPAPAFGSVLIEGVNYAPAAFNYGKPPADVMDSGSGNLAPHDVFPTYYLELGFSFDALHTVGKYNTQDGSTAPGWLYYYDFSVDVTGLQPGYALHFDLYNESVKKGLPTLGDFAPFSHDAESGHQVPDGGMTLAMLGMSLFGLCLISWLKVRATKSPVPVRVQRTRRHD